MAFVPKHLEASVQRELLVSRLRDFEQQRLLHGLDLDAVSEVSVNDTNEQAVRQDKVNLNFAIERLDAQIAKYESALASVPGETASDAIV